MQQISINTFPQSNFVHFVFKKLKQQLIYLIYLTVQLNYSMQTYLQKTAFAI